MAKKKGGSGKRPVNRLALARIEFLFSAASMLVDTYIEEERERKKASQLKMDVDGSNVDSNKEPRSWPPYILQLSRFYLQSMKEVGLKTVTRLYYKRLVLNVYLTI